MSAERATVRDRTVDDRAVDDRAVDERKIAFLWIALLATSSLLFSSVCACATPFAALATIAGTRLARRDAIASVTLAWLGNQAIGYFVLHYPRTPDSFGWGIAIGIAAVAAALLASVVARRGQRETAIATLVAFAGAFLVYEGVLFAATGLLASGHGAFAAIIVLRILQINAFSLVGLLILAQGAMAIGLPHPTSSRFVAT